ncbi:hypothetical protein BGZ83_011550 [Gryganskiella cystojenkinii]|nr:hypothetical protein BGZ83_011550 [Gryganskiella cystojenkinii]
MSNGPMDSIENPLQLPEVLFLIGQHLLPTSITNCIRVSHAWHKAFIPFLWTDLEITILNEAKDDDSLDEDDEDYFLRKALPTVEAIQKHASYIRKLEIQSRSDAPPSAFLGINKKRKAKTVAVADGDDDMGGAMLSITCPGLIDLTIIQIHESDPTVEQEMRLVPAICAFIRRHQQTLVSYKTEDSPSGDLIAALASCPQLEKVWMHDNFQRIDPKKPTVWIDEFTSFWSRLRFISLEGYPGAARRMITTQDWPQHRLTGAQGHEVTVMLQDLYLDYYNRPDIYDIQKWIIAQSPRLVRLHWHNGGQIDRAPMRDLAQMIQSGRTCQQLGDLGLRDSRFDPEDWELLLRSLTRPLLKLDLQDSNFALESWKAVQRVVIPVAADTATRATIATSMAPIPSVPAVTAMTLVTSLRSLLLSGCKHLPGLAIQEMMCCMPNLEVFSATGLKDKDIRKHNRPWVCLKLRKLSLTFMVSSSSSSFTESETMICSRLAQLTKLEVLDEDMESSAFELNSEEEDDEDGDSGGSALEDFSLKLSGGLDQLRTLGRLRRVGLILEGDFGKAEARSMELPEIRLRVCQYLTSNDLVACIQVSKSWHATFVPCIYEDFAVIQFSGDECFIIRSGILFTNEAAGLPSRTTLERYAHHIRDLSLDLRNADNSFIRHVTTFARNLRSLSVSESFSRGEQPSVQQVHGPVLRQLLIENHSTIQRLDLSSFEHPVSLNNWIVETILTSPSTVSSSSAANLTHVHLGNLAMDISELDSLMTQGLRLNNLSISYCTVTGSSERFCRIEGKKSSESNHSDSDGDDSNDNNNNKDEGVDPRHVNRNNSNITALFLNDNFGSGMPPLVDWLDRCPRLETLSWSPLGRFEDQDEPDPQVFRKMRAQAMLQSTRNDFGLERFLHQARSYPTVTDLALNSVRLNEGEPTKIVARFPNLKRLTFGPVIVFLRDQRTDFGILGRNLFGLSLTVLNISASSVSIKSHIWKEVLETCPGLVELGMDKLEVDSFFSRDEDSYDNVEREGKGTVSTTTNSRWVCRDLKSLSIAKVVLSIDSTYNDRAMSHLMALKQLDHFLFSFDVTRVLSLDEIDEHFVHGLDFSPDTEFEHENDRASSLPMTERDLLAKLYRVKDRYLDREHMDQEPQLRWILEQQQQQQPSAIIFQLSLMTQLGGFYESFETDVNVDGQVRWRMVPLTREGGLNYHSFTMDGLPPDLIRLMQQLQAAQGMNPAAGGGGRGGLGNAPTGFNRNDPRSFFDSVPHLPGPSAFPTLAEVKAETRRRVDKIFKDWTLLNHIILRHEATIQKRWMKKSPTQRKTILQEAWPGIALTHRPDLHLYLQEQSPGPTRNKDPYLWPHLNQEDLLKPKLLLIFINARARHYPSAFAAADHDSFRFAETSGKVRAAFLNDYTTMFNGRNTKETYGQIYSWEDEPDAFGWMFSQRGEQPGKALMTLEVQERIYDFLLKCCLQILHDMPRASLEKDESPIEPEPPVLEIKDDGVVSLSSIATMAPYRLPARLDLARLQDLIAAKKSTAEDHIRSLREDPGYFADTLNEVKAHRQETVPDLRGQLHRLVTPFEGKKFWDRVAGNTISEAYLNLDVWSGLYDQLDHLVVLQEKYKDKIEYEKDLPDELLEAFLDLEHSLDMFVKGPIMTLQQIVPASPPFRPYFVRQGNESLTSNIIPIMQKPGSKWDLTLKSLMYLFQTMWDDQQRHLMGLDLILDGIQHLIQQNPKHRNILSNRVADVLADLALLSEIRQQVALYQPWANTFEEAAAQRKDQMKERYIARTKPLQDAYAALQQVELANSDTSDGRYFYPVDKRRTKETTMAMQEAERNLDKFWEKWDSFLLQKVGVTHQGYMAELLDSHTMKRTADWIEPDVTLRAEDLLKQEEQRELEVAKPLSRLFFDREHVTPQSAESDEPKKTKKVKTRGVPSPAKPAVLSEEQIPDTRPTFKVDKKALKVFKTLFYIPSSTSQPGEIPWTDFLHAMASTGFGMEKLHGSIWHFKPSTLDAERSIQFHEPHPIAKIPYRVARQFGRRLSRAYGWHGQMFQLEGV